MKIDAIIPRHLSIYVLVISLFFSFMAWKYTKDDLQNELLNYFDYRTRQAVSLIETRLRTYEDILKGVRGLFYASDDVSRSEFREYVSSLRLDKNYPGIQGVGFSLIVPKNELEKHINSVRKEGFPNYYVKPRWNRLNYTSIIYLEPLDERNLRAFGYDMYSEPVRNKAMQMSRDSNKTVISGKVELLQELSNNKQAGFLMYLPIYKNGTHPNSVTERRTNVIGWVYAPFRMGDFMTNILGERASDLEIEIYDGDSASSNKLMYDSKTDLGNKRLSKLQKKMILQYAKHNWFVKISSNPGLEKQLDWGKPEFVGIVFVLGSILLTILTWLIQRSREQTIDLNNTKDKFFSIIAHDLRGPFTGFLGYSEMLSTQIDSLSREEIIHIGTQLYTSAKNLYLLLSNLLDWSRVQMKNFALYKEKLLLANEVTVITEPLKITAKLKEISLINSVDESLHVFADKNMLRLVLGNLISNALKFTYREGNITILAELKEDATYISVKDTGIGIKEEDLHKLFRIDTRFSTSGTADEKGTGFGLMICKEIVEKHRGKIWVTSRVNQGTTFTFTLPNNTAV